MQHRPELNKMYQSMPTPHQAIWNNYIGGYRVDKPDLVIAPEGDDKPYLYRWYLLAGVPKEWACVYFHLQVQSDPERPLHDHPWDNTSHILVGGYDEMYNSDPTSVGEPLWRELRVGAFQPRLAEVSHRLVLPDGIPYTMSMFAHGEQRRDWGFWYPDGWHDSKYHVATRNGASVHVNRR